MAEIVLKETAAADVPTPPAGKSAVFIDAADSAPKYRDDTGSVNTFGGGLSQEQIQDMLATFLVAGANVTLTYDDVANTLTVAATGGGLTQEQVEDFVGAMATDSSDIDFTYNDAAGTITAVIKTGSVTNAMLAGSIALSKLATDPLARANHTGTQTASTVSDFSEAVDDRVAALLVAGANITLTYDDTANTLTVAATDTNLTTEQVQDIVGAFIADTSVIDATYDDAGNVESFTIAAGSVTNAMLAGSIALSKLATDPLARANHTGTQLMATISDAGALATKSAVASADITDGTIVNGDINAAAAIARSKLDFGSGLVNADIAAAAAIALSKLATDPLARSNHTGSQVASTISDFNEAVDDEVNAVLVAGAGTRKVYDDAGNALTVSAPGAALYLSTVAR